VQDDGYAEFYEHTWHRMVTYLYAVSGDRSTAQDLAQEAYARAWQRWGTVGQYSDPEAWVRTVGFRLCLNRWRRARNRLKAYRRYGPADPAGAPSENTVALVTALRSLPTEQRDAIALHHLLDLPVDEVARQTGVSVNTVKSRLARGRLKLAELLRTELASEVFHA
jgi:RNA polymerase sigma-70 factor (sigma-E family)